MRVKGSGFSFIEFVLCVALLALFGAGATIYGVQQVKKGKITSTTSTLQVFATDMEAILEDLGTIEIEEGSTEIARKSDILEYIALIEESYTHTHFDKKTLIISESGFEICTDEQIDGWDAKFKLMYNTNSKKGLPGTCILTSSGPNLTFETDGYTKGEFGDDILLIVQPKG